MDLVRSNGKSYFSHVPECALQRRLADPNFRGSPEWWQRYALEHSWINARRIKLSSVKTCEQCGREGRPPFAELRKLEPARPHEPRWIIAKEKMHREWVLTVIHIVPNTHDLYGDGCHHHADNLRVLCMRCYQASDYYPMSSYNKTR